jgi:5-methyltetrahydrofolate--homocysteine methyltransferase
VQAASELIEKLTAQGIPIEKIYVDPLVQPVSVDTKMGPSVIGAIGEIMRAHPGVNTICGLSNISFGAILDPTDKKLMSTLVTVEMLLGRDEYCEKYIDSYQKEMFADQ